MKKITAFLLCLVMLWMTASCNLLPNETGLSDGSQAEISPDAVHPPFVRKAAYGYDNIFAETPSRVLFVQNGILQYYNKIDGNQYVFCFDPMCEHSRKSDCIALKFMMADMGIQTIEFCEYNNRFYALRGKQFCSFDFDGKDLKIEYSFGEEGKFDEEAYTFSGLFNLKIKGQYAYMEAVDRTNGKINLMRYDVEQKKMDVLFRGAEKQVDGYFLGENCLYVHVISEEAPGLYQMTMDGKLAEKLTDDMTISLGTSVLAGETLYYFHTEKVQTKWGLQDREKELVSFHMKTGEQKTVYTADYPAHMKLLAVTEDTIYFTKEEPISQGVSSVTGEEEINIYSKVYAIDRKTDTVKTVFDNLQYSIRQLCFFDDKVLMQAGSYQSGYNRLEIVQLTVKEDRTFQKIKE